MRDAPSTPHPILEVRAMRAAWQPRRFTDDGLTHEQIIGEGLSPTSPLHFEALRLSAERYVGFAQRLGEPLAVFADNRTTYNWRGELVVRRVNLAGMVLAEAHHRVTVPGESSAILVELTDPQWAAVNDEAALLIADLDQAARAVWVIGEEDRLAYPQPRFTTKLIQNERGARWMITAQSLLRDVCLFVNRLDAHAMISDQAVTLLPGESHRFIIDTDVELDEATLAQPPVFACANMLGDLSGKDRSL